MFAMRSRNFQFGLLFATMVFMLMTPSPGHAYTPEQQQACTDDAFRLCGPDIPDVDRVTACMVRNKSQLSPGCAVYFRSPEPVASGKPVSITPTAARKSAGVKPRKPKKPAASVAN